MRIFISADIEGVNGIAVPTETSDSHKDYPPFAKRMSLEVAAVCEGILSVDPTAEIFIKDAHGTARNILHDLLPKNTTLFRGWANDPYGMMSGIDVGSYDGVIFVGYHGGATYDGNPLSHTSSGRDIFALQLNGERIAEFHLNRYTALYNNIPVIMLSGDKKLCDLVKTVDENITTVATFTGSGAGVYSPHPEQTRDELKAAAAAAVKTIGKQKLNLPESFDMELTLKSHALAKKGSYYPGAKLKDSDPMTVKFTTHDYFEILRAYMFMK